MPPPEQQIAQSPPSSFPACTTASGCVISIPLDPDVPLPRTGLVISSEESGSRHIRASVSGQQMRRHRCAAESPGLP